MTNLQQFGYAPENTEADGGGFDPLPAGEYAVVPTSAEIKDTKDGTGKYLNVEFEVIDGNFKSRKVWNIYNLINKSEKAQRKGHAQLKALSEACGKPNAVDATKLLNSPLILKLSVRKSEEYGDSNDVKAHKPYVAGQAAGQTAQGAAQAGGEQKAPW